MAAAANFRDCSSFGPPKDWSQSLAPPKWTPQSKERLGYPGGQPECGNTVYPLDTNSSGSIF